jgi:hypothetical protein
MGERRVETSIEIEAAPEQVWALLTDFADMPDWNPFIRSIVGSPQPGNRLSVEVALPGKRRRMRFKPVVLVADPGRELRWLARLPLPGLFDGEHYFLLEPAGVGRTRLIHGETFSGLLVALLGGTVSAAEDGYNVMNAALKRQAERKG